MAISSKKQRREAPHLDIPKCTQLVSVTEIKNDHYYQNLTIDAKSKGTIRFNRLRYFNCPPVKKDGSGQFVENHSVRFADRDKLVDEVYGYLSGLNPITAASAFSGFIAYFNWADDKKIKASFEDENILRFMDYLVSAYRAGIMAKSSAAQKKGVISAFLRSNNRKNLVKQLPVINKRTGNHKTPSQYDALTDSDYVKVGKQLFTGYKSLALCIRNNIEPKVCPHFDAVLAQDISPDSKPHELRHSAIMRLHSPNASWQNYCVKHAILITYMFTGLNPTPLFDLRIKDVSEGFKKGVGDYYVLNSIKGRALYQEQQNELGFTKYAKEFFESWLRLLNTILTFNGREMTENDPVFPFITKEKMIRHWSEGSTLPQLSINKALRQRGLPTVNSNIYRKSRAEKLYRATGSISTVAEANNNTERETERSYLFGSAERHQKSLTSAMMVQLEVVYGEDKGDSIARHNDRIIDPLKDFNPEQGDVMNTPSGHCRVKSKAAKKKAEKSKRKHRGSSVHIQGCLDFWACFSCPAHAIVANKDEIHKLLSLRDCVGEKLTLPTINNSPNNDLTNIMSKLESLLAVLASDFEAVFNQAKELNKTTPHPLWSDSFALDDISGVLNWQL